MIKEDKSAQANMPQNVVMKPYPKNNMDPNYYYNDEISGIDSLKKQNVSKLTK